MRTVRVVPLLGAGLGGLLLTGCAGGSADGPRAAVDGYLAGWERGDGEAVCALLAPETRSEVEKAAKKACAEAILDEDLPAARAVRDTQVWGDAAIVRLDADTVFLAEFRDGWKIVAAGCAPRGGQPYDCQVQGG